jgi:hypothetical protein
MESLQGIDRVGPTAAVDLQRTHLEARVPVDESPTHRHAMLGTGVVRGRLPVRREVDWYEQDPLEPELRNGVLRHRKMSYMGRVE